MKELQTSFCVAKKDLKMALRVMNLSIKYNSRGDMNITVLPDAVEFKNHGVTHRIAASTDGLADIVLPFKILDTYLTSSTLHKIRFKFRNGVLVYGSSTYVNNSIKVRSMFNTKVSDLPVNADNFTVLKFCNGKSRDELDKSGILAIMDFASRCLDRDIEEAVKLLKKYKVKDSDIREMIKQKITSGS